MASLNANRQNPYYMNPTLPVSMFQQQVHHSELPQKKRLALVSYTPSFPAPNPPPQLSQRRVWVKTLNGNGAPTTIIVSDFDIIDDLKSATIAKFPNTLGRYVDLADLTIKLEFGTRQGKKEEPQALLSVLPDGKSPISPQVGKNGLYKYLNLEPDQNVFSILDTYYPNGMTMADALLIEVASTPHKHPGAFNHQQLKFHLPQPQHVKPPHLATLPRRLSPIPAPADSPTLPRAASPMQPTQVIHRRSQLNPPQSPALSLAVLLLPKNFSLETTRQKQPPEKQEEKQGLPRPDAYSMYRQDAPKLDVNTKVDSIPSEPVKTARQAPKRSKLGGKIKTPTNTDNKVLPLILVLVVEDNAINQAILGAFLRKHKIHYLIAKNGQEAIDKWRTGGFHLVLMDIQLPVKLGIEATKEIRRLEKINRIGVFVQDVSSHRQQVKDEEKLDVSKFRSPVIIVALTASLNSSVDRQNALMAGCNDYLTKPVNMMWLQNKITEWGCMQALIDYDWWKAKRRQINDNNKEKRSISSGEGHSDRHQRMSTSATR